MLSSTLELFTLSPLTLTVTIFQVPNEAQQLNDLPLVTQEVTAQGGNQPEKPMLLRKDCVF